MAGIILAGQDTVVYKPLVDLPDMIAALKLMGLETEDENVLQHLIFAASDFIEGYLHRHPWSNQYAGTMDGDGTAVLYPKEANGWRLKPITALTSLVVSDMVIDVADPDECLLYGEKGYVRLLHTCFIQGYANVEITLSAGYAEIPPSIRQACIELVGLKWMVRDKRLYATRSISVPGGESVNFDIKDLPEQTKAALDRHYKLRTW
jgi:hypothetical protein